MFSAVNSCPLMQRGFQATTMEDIALGVIGASWASADEQAALRTRFLAEMAGLRVQQGMAPRS